MADLINDIVQVTITRATAVAQVASFDGVLIASEFDISDVTVPFTGRVRAYGSLSEITDDGFATSSPVYLAAKAFFLQNPNPGQIYVGRKSTNQNTIQKFTLDAAGTGGTFTITYDGNTTAGIAYDAATGTIETAIEGLTGITSVTVTGTVDAGTEITVEFDGADANTLFSALSMDVSLTTTTTTATQSYVQYGSAADASWGAALTAIKDASNAWYGFSVGTKTLSDLQAVADWTETNDKLFIISDDDTNIIDSTGDIAEYVQTNDYDRTAVIYHPESDLTTDDEFPEMAWLGLQFTKDPGSSNWAWKSLTGVTTYDLTTAQKNTAEGKDCNLYQEIASNNVMRYGTVGSGEYIDIIRGTDWLEARIQEQVFTSFLNNEKISFDDGGIQAVVSLVKAALQEAVDATLITADYEVTAPAAADVSAANKAARTLPDIEFTATYAGAINKTQIQGTISL